MTCTPAPETQTTPVSDPRQDDWRTTMVVANGWLIFLLFPLISIALADLSTGRKLFGYAAIAVFALVHVLAYRAMSIRERVGSEFSQQTTVPVGPLSPWPYLAVFIVMTAVAISVVGPGLLGFLPFIVVFGIFNFRWSIAATVLGACVIACVVVPIAFDLFPDLFFFVIIVISTGAGASLTRMAEQASLDQSTLRTDLALSSERNRVARDVHDVLGHSLTAVILKTQVCEQLLDSVEPADEEGQATLDQVKAELAELDTVSRRAMAEIRSTVGGLRTASLSDELAAARAVLADAGTDLTVQGDPNSVSADFATTIAWVVRESITNVVRHARAESCIIEFPTPTSAGIPLVRITDDGVGFVKAAVGASSGNGIRGMHERVNDAGAELRIEPGTERGTRVEVHA